MVDIVEKKDRVCGKMVVNTIVSFSLAGFSAPLTMAGNTDVINNRDKLMR